MPAYAPKPDDLPILDDDNTMEADMRWLLTDNAEFRSQIESSGADAPDQNSIEYKDPTVGSLLTATQVIDLLSLGK